MATHTLGQVMVAIDAEKVIQVEAEACVQISYRLTGTRYSTSNI